MDTTKVKVSCPLDLSLHFCRKFLLFSGFTQDKVELFIISGTLKTK